MSNTLFMDESNGNGVFASKSKVVAAMMVGAAATTNTNNINSIMNGVATTTQTATLPTSVSNEDLSQSLSEYTDADESISAPTEFLAEFLSAVMLKDYRKALKYCKLILQYEPNNATAKEFYPLIQDKLREKAINVNSNSDSDENYNKSSSPEMLLELQQSTEPSAGESDEASDDQHAGGDVEDFGTGEDNSSGENISSSSSDGSGMAGASISDSVDEDEEDEEDDDDDDADDDVEVEDDDDDDDDDADIIGDEDEEDANSSSGDDLPIDANHLLCADDAGGGHGGHGSNSSRNSSSGGEGRSRSDNTTHSYSSLLLEEEEEDDIVLTNIGFNNKELSSTDLDVSNGNKINSTSCSDSESPTEPLTQRLAAILRSKCVVNTDGDNY